MLSKGIMGWAAVVAGVLIALTEFMEWQGYLHYIWAVLVLIWGIVALNSK